MAYSKQSVNQGGLSHEELLEWGGMMETFKLDTPQHCSLFGCCDKCEACAATKKTTPGASGLPVPSTSTSTANSAAGNSDEEIRRLRFENRLLREENQRLKQKLFQAGVQETTSGISQLRMEGIGSVAVGVMNPPKPGIAPEVIHPGDPGSGKAFSCTSGPNFVQKRSLTTRIRSTATYQFECRECHHKLYAFATFKKHMFKYHQVSLEEICGCGLCGQTFKTREGLKGHRKSAHNNY